MGEKLLKIINHFGVDNQQRKLEEEVFEFQKEIDIAEASRLVGISNDISQQSKEHLEEEAGDILNVLYQFILYYKLDVDKIHNSRLKKIDRTLEVANECNN